MNNIYGFEWPDSQDADEENQILLNDLNTMHTDNRKNLQEEILQSRQISNRKVVKDVELTDQDKKRAHQQPHFHQKNKSLAEILFGNCCVTNNDINQIEKKFYQEFKNQMVEEYDENNILHEQNLKMFFQYVFKNEEDIVINDLPLISDVWKDIGFQQRNPRTDFRGGGHLSLLCLIYISRNYPREFDEMITVTKEKQELMWLTAISSINVTYNLIIYFYMNDGDVSPQYSKIRAGRKQFKKFCRLNYQCKRTFFELSFFALRYIYFSWIQLIKSHGVQKVPMLLGSFNDCMNQAKQAINNLLSEKILDYDKMLFKIDTILQERAALSN